MEEVISKYNPEWPKQFETIESYLKKHIRTYRRIEHVGSTSIPEMDGKPVIDIDIEIASRNEFNKIKNELEKIGYSYEGNQGIEDREVFKRTGKQNNVLDQIRHHLYVCPSDSRELHRHLLFRNALRGNKTLRKEYIEIKEKIIEKVGKYNRAGYVEMKEKDCKDFFERVLNSGTSEADT
jgi:GrpB-like predicted nucleotidyltransferase (UPF0157 family)